MQRKLATWAATDPSLRIQRLLRLITQPEWLAEAARITLSSKGAHTPGVDGVNKTMLQARLAVLSDAAAVESVGTDRWLPMWQACVAFR